MNPDPPSSTWAQKALTHARHLARTPRGSTTRAEAQAAAYVRQQLEKLGAQNLRLQPFQGLRSLWLFMAQAYGLALVGHAAYWLLRQPFGAPAALLVMAAAFGLSGVMLWRKFTFRDYPLRSILPHGPSQNVIATLPPRRTVKQRLVLVGHLDSHRAVFWFAHDWLVTAFAISEPFAIYGVLAAPLYYLAAFLTGWRLFGWLGAFLALVHFATWFTGVTADLGPYSPGANDNASAVGTVLALAERLRQEPLENTEVWLALTGCEETGCDGMRTFLQAYGEQLKDALVLDFELVGIGEQLVYLHDEGVVRRRSIAPDVERLVQAAGAPFGLRPASTLTTGAFTEAGTAWEHGFRAVCLLVQRNASRLMPQWHRLTDTGERLEEAALRRVHDLAWAILKQVDERDSF